MGKNRALALGFALCALLAMAPAYAQTSDSHAEPGEAEAGWLLKNVCTLRAWQNTPWCQPADERTKALREAHRLRLEPKPQRLPELGTKGERLRKDGPKDLRKDLKKDVVRNPKRP